MQVALQAIHYASVDKMKALTYHYTRFALSLCLILAFISIAQISQAEEKLSLDDCYKLTLERSERLQIKSSEVAIAKAQYDQAFSVLFPNISLGADQVYRDNSDFGRVSRAGSTVEDGAGSSGGQGGSLGRSQLVSTIHLTQPIFHGFRNVLLADALKFNQQASELDETRERELLFLDVAELFYQALFFEADIDVFEKTDDVLQQRIKELKEFVNLGKARESEILAAQSELADLRATKERSKGSLSSTKELLAFLVGIPAATFSLNYTPWVGVDQSLSNAISKALERTDLKAHKMRVEATTLNTTAVERERWPAIDLESNGYAFEDPDRNRDWDVLLRLEMPIFDAGRITARADEARAQQKISELNRDALKRSIEREVRVAYSAIDSTKAQASALKELVSTSRRNYESQRKDYSLGVVTNLEVLQAIRTTQDSERRLKLAELELDLNHQRLDVAVGGLTR